ncbi:hypothetical protein Tco_0682246 [Tanacetum coccineum]|uniref:Uncharacterized protein n=1 Tax=Tanacetum coccineum TaxID=301880 RepID=A0ABQ4XS60_9ASTR
MDEELAQRLFEEEQAQFEKEQRIAREKVAEQDAMDAVLIEQMEDQARMLVDLIAERKKFFATQRAEQIRNKPPTRAQLRNKMTVARRMVTVKSKQKVVRRDQGRIINEESGSRAEKHRDVAEREEALELCWIIVQGDDIAMDFESLSTKYPTID